MDATTVLAHATGCVLVPVAGQGVVVDETGSRLHVLDGPGREVWELLEGTASLAAVTDVLARRHAVPRDDVEAGVLSAAMVLVDASALVVLPRKPPRT